jgi:hypothetical protein
LQPQLPYRNLDDIVQKVSAQFLGGDFDDLTWCFAIQKTLAFISPASRRIQIHNVLNATDVPNFEAPHLSRHLLRFFFWHAEGIIEL